MSAQPQSPAPPGLTVDIEGAAALLQVHHSTVRDLANSGQLPGRRVGRRWVFVTEDVLEYIRSGNKRQPTWHSSDARSASNPSASAGCSRSGSPGQMDDEYRKLLGLPTAA